MRFHRLLVLATFVCLCLPAIVQAQSEVTITQDSCVTVDADHQRVYFTIINHSSNYENLCSFQFTPIPSPATPECTVIGFGGEPLWVGSPNPDGGIWFGVPPTEYPFACISHSADSRGGFYITIDPGGDCCYEATFTNSMYQTWWTMTWCPGPCTPTPVEHKTWGMIKKMYN